MAASLSELGRVVRSQPYAYRTSWPLEEVELVRADGTRLTVLVKRLEDADVLKPDFVVDPAREPAAYRILECEDLGTPQCYASGGAWIAIEKVPGIELWQCAGLDAWEATARWAARLHARFTGREPASGHLLRHDQDYYRRWITRARESAADRVDGLVPAAERAVARLASLPRTFIHGELYASNVIIAGERVAAIDWEMAAVGPAVIDLAALTTGWGKAEQDTLCRAYGGCDPADVAAGRLLLALQWIGWLAGWEAPPEHRRDWFAEAREAAEELR